MKSIKTCEITSFLGLYDACIWPHTIFLWRSGFHLQIDFVKLQSTHIHLLNRNQSNLPSICFHSHKHQVHKAINNCKKKNDKGGRFGSSTLKATYWSDLFPSWIEHVLCFFTSTTRVKPNQIKKQESENFILGSACILGIWELTCELEFIGLNIQKLCGDHSSSFTSCWENARMWEGENELLND